MNVSRVNCSKKEDEMTQREIADLGVDGCWDDFMKRAGEFDSWSAVLQLMRWADRMRPGKRSKKRLQAGVQRALDCYQKTFGMEWVPF